MLLVDGNPNLVGQTRHYASDPGTAANPRWTDQQVKDQINIVYLELMDLIRVPGTRVNAKRSYLDGQAVATPEDHFYPLPEDFAAQLRVEISENGSDLSSTLPGSEPEIKVLKPVAYDVALDHYNVTSGGTSDIQYVFRQGNSFGISTPLTSTEAGTRSIRLTYEGTSALLIDDADEPDLPRAHHDAINLGAAVKLRMGWDLPVGDLARTFEMAKLMLRRATTEPLADMDHQIDVRTLKRRARRSNVGKVRRLSG